MGKKTKKPSKQKTAGTAKRPPLAALYNLDEGTPRGDAVRAVLAAQGIRVRTVGVDQLGSPVGAIMGLPGFGKSALAFAGDAPTSEFMLLDNVSSAQLNDLLF